MTHKAGFVNILGHPNVGKSTLMNLLIGEKLSIITAKAQTTRHRILGIVNGPDYQVIYSDTPGILKPHYKLHKSMMKFIDNALQDADVFLYMTEVGENTFEEDVIRKIQASGKPLILIINKVDLASPEEAEQKVVFWKEQFPGAEVIPIAAKLNYNIGKISETVLQLLPENPPYYPKDDELSDRPLRFFISEIIREKIFLQFTKEVPYSTEVVVESYKEGEKMTVIAATIFVERETQKAILLGHKGAAIKKLGIDARKDIEVFIGTKVYLELSVKVSDDWREDERQLRRFGYEL
ncbi:MAG TPA: GTPase Era [Bacteroidales bacterium]|nr:GTPase Era [Bacteroidales bacterium]HPT01953.1 GTPase Era [Bacteroidales bacterium]